MFIVKRKLSGCGIFSFHTLRLCEWVSQSMLESHLVAFTSLSSQVRYLNPYLHDFRSNRLKQFSW